MKRKITILLLAFAMSLAFAFLSVTDFAYAEDNSEIINSDIAARFDVPYVATYYFNPKPAPTDNIVIPLYITDSSQSEYLPQVTTNSDKSETVKYDTSVTLNLLYEIDEYKYEIKNLPLGDYNLNLGYLSSGNHVFSVQVEDPRTGLTSHKLYNDLWVIDPSEYNITEAQTYRMSEKDLVTYKINNEDSTNIDDMNNTRDGLNALFTYVKSQNYRKIILLEGIYRINGEDPTGARSKCINIPSNFTVDMNGCTFKLNPILTDIDYVTTQNLNTTPAAQGCLILFDKTVDSHLMNGTLIGDRETRINAGLESYYANKAALGEAINTILMTGGKYCSLSNLTIKDTTGHTVMKFYEWGEELFLEGYTRTAIFDGTEIAAANCSTSAYTDLTKIINRNASEADKYMGENYMYVGHPQGYRGICGDSAIVYVSFYDANKKYLETITGYQYRKIQIPTDAKYARVTLLGTNFTELDYSNPASRERTVSIYSKHYGDYFEFTGLDFYDTRTCALAPAVCNNLLIENCTYTGCGNSITPAAVDFEDGAQECQDIYYQNNTVLKSAGTATLIDNYGFNHIFINNTNHSYEIRNRVGGGLITGRKDKTSYIVWRLGDKVHAAFGRIMNNTCGMINVTDDKGDRVTKEPNPVDFVVKNCDMYGGTVESAPKCVTYEDCIFRKLNTGPVKMRNCTVQFANASGSFVGTELYCYDCTFTALDGSAQHNINWNQAVSANRLFVNCKFEGKTVFNFFLASGTFIKCNFEDISITGWASDRSEKEAVLFEECTFYSTGGFFFDVGPYSYNKGYINYTFRKCTITHTGKNLVQVSATPTNNEGAPSQVVFDQCTINKPVNTEPNDRLGFEFIKVVNEAPKLETSISGYSISLSDQIAVNFHIAMSDSLKNNSSAIIRFTLPGGKTTDVKMSDGVKDTAHTGTYIYTCKVPASQMTSTIYAQVMIPAEDASASGSSATGSSSASTGSAPASLGNTYSCSVKAYADAVLNGSGYTSEQIAMVKAMLNYGGYAQKYFNVNTSSLANNNLYTQANDPVLKEISALANITAYNIPSNNLLDFAGASLICEGETSLRLYFNINGSSASANKLNVSITSGGKERTCCGTVTDSIYVVTLYNITATELDDVFSFTIKDASGSAQTITFNYSPMNYIALAQSTGDINLMYITRALYHYNQAANKCTN